MTISMKILIIVYGVGLGILLSGLVSTLWTKIVRSHNKKKGGDNNGS